MGLTIEFISILDEGGVEVFSYPPQSRLDMMGGAIVATIEMMNKRNQEILEKIYLEDLVIYIRKLKGNATLIIAFKNFNKKFIEAEVSWFIEHLTEEIIRGIPGGNILFVDQVRDVLEPMIGDAIDLFEDICDHLERLNEAYKLATEIIGEKARELIETCCRNIVNLEVKDGKVFIKSVQGNLKSVLNSIISCKETLKNFIKTRF